MHVCGLYFVQLPRFQAGASISKTIILSVLLAEVGEAHGSRLLSYARQPSRALLRELLPRRVYERKDARKLVVLISV